MQTATNHPEAPLPTSSREDVSNTKSKLVRQAEHAIAEYSTGMTEAYSEAEPLLYRALQATYAAALDLMKHPDLMGMFLDDRRSGPSSRNPFKPIVRKLWKGAPARDTIHRYAGCMAWAHREEIKPVEFVEKIRKQTIKAAAAEWSRREKNPEERLAAKVEQKAKATEALDRLESILLPEDIACSLEEGCGLAVIRKSPDGTAALFLFKGASPATVDAFIIREARR